MYILLIVSGCGKTKTEDHLFIKLSSSETNIHFENILIEEELFNSINYLYFYDGGGVAVGDINNDGLADIYFTANMYPNRLYLNEGDFHFVDITKKAGVFGGIEGWTTGVTMADVNGDGFLDIYVCSSNLLDKRGANLLFINNGDLTFTESGAEYGLNFKGLSRQATFFDYDLDNDLDMFLLNHSIHSKGTYGHIELRNKRDVEVGDKLYRNDNGRFIDVTTESGIYESILGYGLGVAVGDINWDGYPDIYISNDFHEDDYLYYNNGNGTFTEALRSSVGHTSRASMGNDLADVNNDGLLDVVVVDMMPAREDIRKSSVFADPFNIDYVKQRFGYHYQYRRNTLLLNRGNALKPIPGTNTAFNLFSEIGQLAGIHATDWSWAPLFVDLDNDGHKDLFVSNGIYRRPNDLDYLDHLKNEVRLELNSRTFQSKPAPIDSDKLAEILQYAPSVPIPNYVFQSQGDLTYINRASEWGLGEPGFSSGAAYADFNNDGGMDLVVNNTNSPATIYKNLLYFGKADSLYNNNYIKIQLVGKGLNTNGMGSKVLIYANENIFFQELMVTRGFQSAVEPVLNFGLGNTEIIDSLRVIWPTGEHQVLFNLKVNQRIRLDQINAADHYIYENKIQTDMIFQDVSEITQIDYKHQENTFIEFNREPFIPHFLSMEGPAFDVADVNNDGLIDLYLGGGKHQPGAIYLQNDRGEFKMVVDSVFIRDSHGEGVDAVFFNANNDEFPDLYVAKGGNEFFAKMEPLKDCLYFGVGNGRFVKSKSALPDIYANSACVRPADIDNDGDMDLFIGSRSVPREYGIIPKSYLLINDGAGNFTDATSKYAPAVSNVGMVTDAIWIDLNDDSYEDLVLVGEWMPIRIFYNSADGFTEVTDQYGLQNTTGWWNTIAAGDFNNDGHIDLVVGNLGLNSFLKASNTQPVQLYINDFSGNNKLEQILTYYNGSQVYPLASRDMMIENIPFLVEKYPKYADFAGAAIDDIFNEDLLQSAQVRKAVEFASVVLMNNGDETFTKINLPIEVQFSPVYAILVDDFDKDGFQDMLTGGNFSGVPPELGRYDASYGNVLLGEGTGSFTSASLQSSGFIVTGEIRQMKKIKTPNNQNQILVVRNNNTTAIFNQLQNK
jgi:hypothetical protein